MLNVKKGLLVVSAVALMAAGAAQADVFITGGGDWGGAPGWDTPPSSLGGRGMTPYALFDPQPGTQVTSAWSGPGPIPAHTTHFGGATFQKASIGAGWATWSGGYTGSVYWSLGATSATLTFSSASGLGTKGFYFMIEPNPFSVHPFTVTVTGSQGDTATLTQSANGQAGAVWFGAWATNGRTITSIQIDSPDGVDFAIGRFGYNLIPTPGALALLGLAGFAGRRRRA
jgi:hypothetical protein